jgi:hypothetical protein
MAMTQGRGRPAPAVTARRRGTAMVTRQRQPESWLGRLANEVYVGAVVLGLGMVVAGVIALVVTLALRVNAWVMMVGG